MRQAVGSVVRYIERDRITGITDVDLLTEAGEAGGDPAPRKELEGTVRRALLRAATPEVESLKEGKLVANEVLTAQSDPIPWGCAVPGPFFSEEGGYLGRWEVGWARHRVGGGEHGDAVSWTPADDEGGC